MPAATAVTDPTDARWEHPINRFDLVFRPLLRDLYRDGVLVGSEKPSGHTGKAKLVLRNGHKVTVSNTPSAPGAADSLRRAIEAELGETVIRGTLKHDKPRKEKGLGRGAPPAPSAPGWPTLLRNARTAQNVSGQFLADMMNKEGLKVGRSTIGHWESGAVPTDRIPLSHRQFLDTYLDIEDPELAALEAAAKRNGDTPAIVKRREAIAADLLALPETKPQPTPALDPNYRAPEEIAEESRLAAVRDKRNENALKRAFPEQGLPGPGGDYAAPPKQKVETRPTTPGWVPQPVVSPEHRATEERLKTMAGIPAPARPAPTKPPEVWSQPKPGVADRIREERGMPPAPTAPAPVVDYDHFNERLAALGREIYAAGREDGERQALNSGEFARLKQEIIAIRAERDALQQKLDALAAVLGK